MYLKKEGKIDKDIDILIEEFDKEVNEYIEENITEFSLDEFIKIKKFIFTKLNLNDIEIGDEKNFLYIKNISSNLEKEENYEMLQKDFYSSDISMILDNGISKNKFLENVILSNITDRIKIDDNKEFIKNITKIENYPLVKWPTKYNPSLMQTIAINISIKDEEENNIFSVNGPPGTGKTTLLKEIIADNIFKRAKIISKLSPNKFETEKVGELEYYIIPNKLKKLGIVVSSNNNAAVENISKDLPKASDVKKKNTFTDNFDIDIKEEIYFTELAEELFFFKSENKKEKYWGLISAPYGKKDNRDKIFELLKKDNLFIEGIDFEEIRNKFNKKLEEVEKFRDEIKEKADEILEMESKIEKIGISLEDLENILKTVRENLKKIEKDIVTIEKNKKLFEEKRENMKKSFFQKIINWFTDRIGEEKIKINNEINKLIDQIIEKNNKKMSLIKEEENTEEKIKIIKRYKELVDNYLKEYKNSNIMNNNFLKAIEINEKSQEFSPWLNDDYNKLREELFYYSLYLLKAYIVNSKEIKENLKILKDIELKNSDNEKISKLNNEEKNKILKEGFYTLNLLIPVLSTTFASVNSAFKNLKESELGLVIIDEAGQGTPYSSIGILYRASKAIIVGDPLQVEPVVTIPETLNRLFLEKNNLRDEDLEYGNLSISIQSLADRANKYYGKIGKVEVGCPLVVHRRCESPMFDISNKISYDNRMINKTIKSNENNFVLEKSEFIHIKGKEKGNKNHFVKEQGDKVIELIKKSIQREINPFSNKSLYIITPFTSIEKEIIELLKNEFEMFDKNIVGTVHKFQGKEADSVIIILGCDKDNEGAAKWVANQPNILNVAVTRAKRRIAIIGDRELWKDLPNFNEAIKIIENFNKMDEKS